MDKTPWRGFIWHVWHDYLGPTSIRLSRVSDNETRCYKSPWWRHQVESPSALLALCAGNSPSPVNSPHKGQWRGTLMFSLICARRNGKVNNRDTGDLRRHRTHYVVIVMSRCVFVYGWASYRPMRDNILGLSSTPIGWGFTWPQILISGFKLQFDYYRVRFTAFCHKAQ